MTIRSKLLLLLLPTLCAFVMLISFIFYFNWSKEILDEFKSHLQSIVVASSEILNSEDVLWVSKNLRDPNLSKAVPFQNIERHLQTLIHKLPITNLYILRIDPVKLGDAVLFKEPVGEKNPVYLGTDPAYAYREVYLIDVSKISQTSYQPGDIDFVDAEEQRVYLTKNAWITPIYTTKRLKERLMSGYAPIFDHEGRVIALLGADVYLGQIEAKLHNVIVIIVLGAIATILLGVISIYAIANNISKPVRKLNQAALDIAAGQYEIDIEVKGPKEVVELANTLNTMSECLEEHISRLRENSLMRESLYGEYECAMLLQRYMLDNVVDDFYDPHLIISKVCMSSSMPLTGLLLNTFQNKNLELFLCEASEPGLGAMYKLINMDQYEPEAFLRCTFNDTFTEMAFVLENMPAPFAWSAKEKKIKACINNRIHLNPGDMIFLYNKALAKQLVHQEQLERWFSKILRHFSDGGLELVTNMITSELNFIAIKENLDHELNIVCLQIATTERQQL